MLTVFSYTSLYITQQTGGAACLLHFFLPNNVFSAVLQLFRSQKKPLTCLGNELINEMAELKLVIINKNWFSYLIPSLPNLRATFWLHPWWWGYFLWRCLPGAIGGVIYKSNRFLTDFTLLNENNRSKYFLAGDLGGRDAVKTSSRLRDTEELPEKYSQERRKLKIFLRISTSMTKKELILHPPFKG